MGSGCICVIHEPSRRFQAGPTLSHARNPSWATSTNSMHTTYESASVLSAAHMLKTIADDPFSTASKWTLPNGFCGVPLHLSGPNATMTG